MDRIVFPRAQYAPTMCAHKLILPHYSLHADEITVLMHSTRKFGVSRWIILPAFVEEKETERSMDRAHKEILSKYTYNQKFLGFCTQGSLQYFA